MEKKRMTEQIIEMFREDILEIKRDVKTLVQNETKTEKRLTKLETITGWLFKVVYGVIGLSVLGVIGKILYEGLLK